MDLLHYELVAVAVYGVVEFEGYWVLVVVVGFPLVCRFDVA